MTPKALSREIKFRVYNTDWKMMVLPEDIYYIKFHGEKNEATCVAFNITTTDGMRNNDYWENPEDIVFMQYTGLHDKNGKEIYEGDIVKFLYKNCIPEEIRTAEVNPHRIGDGGLYKNVSAYYPFVYTIAGSYKDDGRQTAECYLTPPSECEIIGNIYENPSLLTKENN